MFRSIRRKPRYVRAQYAFWGALIPTALIALLWVTTLPYRLQTVNVEMEQVDSVRNAASVADIATNEPNGAPERDTAAGSGEETESPDFSFRESSTAGDRSTSSTRTIRVAPTSE